MAKATPKKKVARRKVAKKKVWAKKFGTKKFSAIVRHGTARTIKGITKVYRKVASGKRSVGTYIRSGRVTPDRPGKRDR